MTLARIVQSSQSGRRETSTVFWFLRPSTGFWIQSEIGRACLMVAQIGGWYYFRWETARMFHLEWVTKKATRLTKRSRTSLQSHSILKCELATNTCTNKRTRRMSHIWGESIAWLNKLKWRARDFREQTQWILKCLLFEFGVKNGRMDDVPWMVGVWNRRHRELSHIRGRLSLIQESLNGVFRVRWSTTFLYL